MSFCRRALVPPPSRTIKVSPSLPKIDSVAWADVYAALQHAAPNTSYVGQVSTLHPGESRPDPGRCRSIETVEPATEGTAASDVDVFSDLDHVDMVTLALPYLA